MNSPKTVPAYLKQPNGEFIQNPAGLDPKGFELRIKMDTKTARVHHPDFPPAGWDPSDPRVPQDVRAWADEAVAAMRDADALSAT